MPCAVSPCWESAPTPRLQAPHHKDAFNELNLPRRSATRLPCTQPIGSAGACSHPPEVLADACPQVQIVLLHRVDRELAIYHAGIHGHRQHTVAPLSQAETAAPAGGSDGAIEAESCCSGRAHKRGACIQRAGQAWPHLQNGSCLSKPWTLQTQPWTRGSGVKPSRAPTPTGVVAMLHNPQAHCRQLLRGFLQHIDTFQQMKASEAIVQHQKLCAHLCLGAHKARDPTDRQSGCPGRRHDEQRAVSRTGAGFFRSRQKPRGQTAASSVAPAWIKMMRCACC